MTPDFFSVVSGNTDYDLLYFLGLFMTGCLFGCTVCSFSCMPIVCTVVMGTRRGFKSGFGSAKKTDTPLCQNQNPKLRLSFLGLITGMLPCVPYTAVMAAAAASGSLVTGGALALCFGLGTSVSPLLIIGGGAGWFSKKILEKTPDLDGIIRKITGGMIVLMGARMLIG